MIKEKKTKTAKIREAIRNLKKPKGALFWTIAYVVGMFIYTAILFGLSIGAVGGILSFKSSDDYAFAQELLINWNKNYISDLKVIKVNEDCPAGYELWHDRSWPGIVEGCNCINNNGGFRKLVTRETCTSLQLNSKCEKVEALDSVPLYLWKQNSKVCLLRQDVSFLSSPENCGSGLKRCGQGNVRFCVAEDKPCPITDVVISGVYEKTGYEKVVLSDTENIFFTRDDTNFPISTFELTEAKFCIFDAKDNITPGRLDYILSRSLRRPCVRDETRFVTLDSQGEKSVYQQNNLFTTLKSLPGYPIPSNDYTWNIGFVRYFEWDDLCRNGPYSLHQVERKIGLSTVLKTAWVAFGVTMISILITGIILPVRHLKLRIREEHMKAAYAKKKKEVPKQQDYKKIFTSAPYLTDKIFKLILLPVLILAIFFTQRENKWFLQAQGNNCGDAITNSYFQTFANKLEEILAIYIALIFIWAIALAADLAYAMFLVLKSNIAIWKFFESKIRKDEEKIVIVTEDELRGLNTSASSRPDSRSKVMPASSDS